MSKHEGTVVVYGKEGCQKEYSTQAPFPKEAKCEKCNNDALITITISDFAAGLSPNSGGYWYHDAASWAIYTCPHCFHTQVKWNQA